MRTQYSTQCEMLLCIHIGYDANDLETSENLPSYLGSRFEYHACKRQSDRFLHLS
jgi:hypothetical protein